MTSAAAAQPVAYLGDRVEAAPTDGISRIRFSSSSDVLLASSWDRTLRLYDAPSGRCRVSIPQPAPLLDCTFQSDTLAYTAGLDGAVKLINLETRAETHIGSHTKAVQAVEVLPSRGFVITGSWDQKLRLWDPRMPSYQNCIVEITLPGKVYSMSVAGDMLVVGASGRHIAIYDTRKIDTGQAEQVRESSLKYQTRCVAAYPDGQGFAVASVEGRVAMEYYNKEHQDKKYAFKCHRRNVDGKDVVFPVHCIAFHPGYETFASGGGDGLINVWDGANKKRLFQTSRYPTSIASLSFSKDGSMLAVASSYAYEQGEREHPTDEIFIRAVQDIEVRPKQKK